VTNPTEYNHGGDRQMNAKATIRYMLLAFFIWYQTVHPALGFYGTALADEVSGGSASLTTAAESGADSGAHKAPVLPGIVQITGGLGFTVALKNDGTVWTWGDNLRGKLGNGTAQTGNRYTPGQVKSLSDVVAVAAGMNHTLALKKDGTVWAWGYNTSGQLGTGNKTDSGIPVQVEGLYNVTAISAGNDFSVALDRFGYVYAWGDNSKGQLGNGTTDASLTPVKIPNLNGVKAIAAGASHVIAISKYNSTIGWGDNSFGQLGIGSSGNFMSQPTLTNAVTSVKAIAAGSSFSMALTDYGNVWTWGSNLRGQLANGNTKDSSDARPVIGGGDVIQIAAGSTHGIALKKDGTVITWGANNFGQLGIGSYDMSTITVSIQGGFGNVALIGSGMFHSMAVKGDGTVWTWGNNLMGQLGDGTTTNRISPVVIPHFNLNAMNPPSSEPSGDGGPDQPVPASGSTIAGGESFSLLKKNGKLWSWGDNMFGQLGDGGIISKNVPSAVSNLNGVVSVAAAANHAAAIKSDGTLWLWGMNAFGQLADGTTAGRSSIGTAPALTDVAQVSAGNAFTVALKKDGTVWAAGDNTFGQLGNGSDAGSNTMVQVPDLKGIVQVEAGYNHVLALGKDGMVWAWGDNANGQLGDGSTATHKVPAPVLGLTDVVAVKAGKAHSLALKKDGTVWAWGFNASGQLGDGSTSNRTIPVRVQGLEHVKSIAAGGNHSAALLSDGTVWTWGFNFFGQLGDGSNRNASAPVKVSGLSHAGEIAAGNNHTIAVGLDGSVWTWGANYSGQLGDSTFNNRNVPVLVTGFSSAFTDVKGHWAEGIISQAVEKGYADGYEDGSFRPDQQVTRAEFAKMVASALKLNIGLPKSAEDWYVPYVDALLSANLYGNEDVHVQWNEPITRLEIARIAVRCTDKELQKQDTVLENKWAVLTATKKGLLQGLDGGALGLEEPTTRAQSIAMIERILAAAAGQTLKINRQAVSNAEAAMKQ
jgi:alpha-tubulin suppressor-like RCC1 family protein